MFHWQAKTKISIFQMVHFMSTWQIFIIKKKKKKRLKLYKIIFTNLLQAEAQCRVWIETVSRRRGAKVHRALLRFNYVFNRCKYTGKRSESAEWKPLRSREYRNGHVPSENVRTTTITTSSRSRLVCSTELLDSFTAFWILDFMTSILFGATAAY